MVMRVVHSVPVRVVQTLVGVWCFVEGSLAQGTTGLAMMTAGSLLIIAAGADVSLFDPLFRGDADRPVSHASPDAATSHLLSTSKF